MRKIHVTLENVEIDPKGLEMDERYKALINIDADLILRFGDDIVFAENLNVLELLSSLKHWETFDFSGSFSFESSDFEDKGIFELLPVENGFLFRSCWEISTTSNTISRDEVTDFISELRQLCKACILAEVGINIEKFCL